MQLKRFEDKINRGEDNYKSNLQRRAEEIRKKTAKADEKHALMASMEHHLRDIESIHKDFKRIEKVDKVVKKANKEKIEEMKDRLKLDDHIEGAK